MGTAGGGGRGGGGGGAGARAGKLGEEARRGAEAARHGAGHLVGAEQTGHGLALDRARFPRPGAGRGGLTRRDGAAPLGDPPLFLGFLLGVHFFWPIRNLLLPTAALSGILLFAFFLIDSYHARSEDKDHPSRRRPRWHIAGAWNFMLLAAIVGAVLVSGVWHPGIEVPVAGAKVPLQSVMRDGISVLVAILSFIVTPKAVHKANEFAWFPILEVAKLFAGLFVTIIPAIAILKAGSHGAAYVGERAANHISQSSRRW